jgi:hypothetical protein
MSFPSPVSFDVGHVTGPALPPRVGSPAGGVPDAEHANESAPAALTRSGADNRRYVLMHPQPSALDALAQAVRMRGLAPASVPVACRCGDSRDGRMLLIREIEDGAFFDTVIEDLGAGDGPSILRCDECDLLLAADLVVLRDRHGRCAPFLAEIAAVA